jgi:putative acetyltransferase
MSAKLTPIPSWFSIRAALDDDLPAIRAVLASVRGEYGVIDETGASDDDLTDLQRNYFSRGGMFEVVEDNRVKRIVGCAGLMPLNSSRAELCKMYLEKPARGHGLGKRLLEDLIAVARRNGFSEVWLETNSTLTEAIALYKKYGFQPLDSDRLLPRCDVAYVLQIQARL